MGGGTGGGKSGKGAGSEREVRKERAGRGIPQDGGRREEQETVTHTQHCLIFCNGKKAKRRKLTQMGHEQGLKGTGSKKFGPLPPLLPPPPPPHTHTIVRLNPLFPVKIARSRHSQFLEHALLA